MIDTFLQSAEAAWKFLILISNGPLGAYALLAALVGSAGVLGFLRRWVAKLPCYMPHCADSRDFIAETGALVAGIACAWVPMPNVYGIMVGLLAGFASPYIWKGLAALASIGYRWLKRKAGDL